MSHLVNIKLEIKNLDALEAACREMGLRLNRGKKTHGVLDINKWKQLEIPCDHTISQAGWHYGGGINVEIGLMRTATGYTMSYDDSLETCAKYCKTGVPIGVKAGQLMQLYGVHAATLKARAMGCMVSRSVKRNGNIELQVTGGSL